MNVCARLIAVVAVAVGLASCSEETACKDGTILLTVDVAQAVPRPDRLSISVSVAGAQPTQSELTLAGNATRPTVAVEFPSGYPVGSAVNVTVVAFAAGQPVAVGSGSVVAPAGCGTLTVIALSPSVDGGIDDGASLPTSGDGGAAPACTPGAKSCNGNIVLLCNAGGALVDSEECTGLCQGGNCVGECTPGALQCVGDGARTCAATGMWGAPVACPAGCAEGGCLPACTAGTTRCNGNQLETCANGAWSNPMACDYTCRAATASAPAACAGECQPGSAPRCLGKVLQNCSVDASWVAQDTCEFVCSPTGCVGECTPDAKRCNGAAVEVCSSVGAWQNVTTCENACNNGTCTPKVPGKPGVAPTAVVTPTTATKVREKDSIVVTFSEEMNTQSVEAAFKVTTIGAATPIFKWTPDKTVLTIDPQFKYPTGSSTAVPKGSYAFTIGTGAKDANGEALAAPVSATYPLLYRRITVPRINFAQRDAQDRLLAGNLIAGSSAEYTFLQAALQSGSTRNDGFVSFALPALPAGYVLEQALFVSEVEATAGSATGAGNFRIADTRFTPPLTSEVFKTTYVPIGEIVAASTLWTVGTKVRFTVTSAVAADYRAAATLSQFRIYLDGMPTSSTRTLRLLRPETNLQIVYLIE
ncbi:MAG: Ig-like domain-containing protein [Deltaproteobacteria bacterium]|nr:Ig-like domain-containing protein [Deltaproteobacteria bacterium]